MSRLIDEAMEKAMMAIENQEGKSTRVKSWRIINHSHSHKIIASVVVIEDDCYDAIFDVWVTIDLETEKITLE